MYSRFITQLLYLLCVVSINVSNLLLKLLNLFLVLLLDFIRPKLLLLKLISQLLLALLNLAQVHLHLLIQLVHRLNFFFKITNSLLMISTATLLFQLFF